MRDFDIYSCGSMAYQIEHTDELFTTISVLNANFKVVAKGITKETKEIQKLIDDGVWVYKFGRAHEDRHL